MLDIYHAESIKLWHCSYIQKWLMTWLSMQGMLTSLLGNLSLLSYFAKKREKEAMVVQTLGVISTYVVIVQLALAESMPLPYFLATSAVVVSGLFLNFMNYFGLLNAGIWRFWEDFITIGGLSVLPQVIVFSFSHPCIIRIRHFFRFSNSHFPIYNLDTDNVVYICPLSA
jgi:hypothetical protein